MHWGQIKSILILSFFILDVYLFAQFLEKKEQADIGVLEQQLSTVEEQLQDDSITFSDLPEETHEETFISVEQQRFSNQDLKRDKPKVQQEPHIIGGTMIVSKLKDSEKIKNVTSDNALDVFNDAVYYADEYDYWGWNETYNVVLFFQNKLDRPIYFNQNGLVMAILNDKDEIVSYVQTMLGEEESLADKRQLIEPLTAIEKVYENGELYPNDDITKVNIGFHTRVPFESGVQVFAPTWKVNVNEEKDYFVNAIEGFMFSTEEEEFIEEVIKHIIRKSEASKEREDAVDDIIKDLEDRLQRASE